MVNTGFHTGRGIRLAKRFYVIYIYIYIYI